MWCSWRGKPDCWIPRSAGRYRITPEGQNFLNRHHDGFPVTELQPLLSNSDEGSEVANLISGNLAENTPDDMMDIIHKQLRNQLIEDILNHLKSVASDRFEEVVIELLERMGYGHGLVTRHTHDGGIDGILTQDVLGLMEKSAFRRNAGATTLSESPK